MTRQAPWHFLDVHSAALEDALAAEVDVVAASAPELAKGVDTLLASQRHQSALRNRLFAVAILGAHGEDAQAALPVSVVSALWWAGAEALDDVVDAAGSAAALPPAVAALTLLPVRYLRTRPGPAEWLDDVVSSGLYAAEGQLSETHAVAQVTPAEVLWAYVGKTGAAYARDAVMAARLAGADLVGWQRFGRLFGLLRQVHNDNSGVAAEDDEDLANATATLLVAHACRFGDLTELRESATRDVAARRELRCRLHATPVLTAYTAQLRRLHAEACRLLDTLVDRGGYRDVLRASLDLSCRLAVPGEV